ncbi:DnaJ domain-containing protein [Paenibacillus sp. CMAA1364]
MKNNEWYSVPGVHPNASWDDIRKAYKNRARMIHSDKGGSHQEMIRLNNTQRYYTFGV